MKASIVKIMSVALVVMFCSCQSNKDLVVPENGGEALSKANSISSDVISPESFKSIKESNTKFAFDFFKTVAKSERKSNIMVSPLSLSMALGMVHNGSQGQAKRAFDKVLNYTRPISEVNQFNKNLIGKLSDDSRGSIMKIANSIWINRDYNIKDNFITANKNYYQAQTSNLDFSNSNSKRLINSWVSDKTNGKIPKIVGRLYPDQIMMLINALYFKADWKYKFNAKLTRKKPFYHRNNRRKHMKVKMMKMKGNIACAQNKLFSSVILPYKGDKFSMVILLPNGRKTTKDVINQMNPQNWKNWLNSYRYRDVEISLPKFKLTYKNSLKDELTKMGLGVIFRASNYFSKITDGPIEISKVIQKTFIKVDEKGTEAAAVTAVDARARSFVYIPTFAVNKPFVYVIKENSTGSICFMGKVSKPRYSKK